MSADVEDVDWSEIVESNLRAVLVDVVGERDRARALAVRLEQDSAQQREKIAAEFDRRAAEALTDSAKGHPSKLQCLYESDVWMAAARIARGEQVGVRP